MDEKKPPEAYIPSETIRVKIFKPEIGYSEEVDIMPSQLPEVQKLVQQGFKVSRVASDKTSSLDAFLSGVVKEASYDYINQIYGSVGGEEVRREAEKQSQREEEERPLATAAGRVVGGLLGAPAVTAKVASKVASKVAAPIGKRVIGGLTGAGETIASMKGSKTLEEEEQEKIQPMAEKEDFTWGDIALTGFGALLGMFGMVPPRQVKVDSKTIATTKQNVKDAYAEGTINIEQAKQLVDQLDQLDVTASTLYIDPKKLQTEIEEANKKGLPVFQYREKPPLVKEDPNNMWDRWRHSTTTFFIKENPEVPPSILQYIMDNVSPNKLPRESLDQASGVMKIPREETVAWLQKVSGALPTKPLDQLGRQRMKTLFGLNDEQINKINSFFQNAGEDLRVLGGNKVIVGSPPPQTKIIGGTSRRQGMFGGDPEKPFTLQQIRQDNILNPQTESLFPRLKETGEVIERKELFPLSMSVSTEVLEEIEQVIPKKITKDTKINTKNIENPIVLEFAQSLEDLKRVANEIGEVKRSNLVYDAELNKIMFPNADNIKFKTPQEFQSTRLTEQSALDEALKSFEKRPSSAAPTPSAPQVPTEPPKEVMNLANLLNVKQNIDVLPTIQERTMANFMEQLGVKPIYSAKQDVVLPGTISRGQTRFEVRKGPVITSQIKEGRGAFGSVHEAARKGVEQVINPEDVDVIKLFSGLKGRKQNVDIQEIGVRRGIEEVRQSNKVPQEVMDHFIPSETIYQQVGDEYFSAVIMPKLQPLPAKLKKEMYKFPKNYVDSVENLKLEKFDEWPTEFKDLYNALEEARIKGGVQWDDIHSGNVMWDPQKNKIVVVDVGNFVYAPGSVGSQPGTRRGMFGNDPNELAQKKESSFDVDIDEEQFKQDEAFRRALQHFEKQAPEGIDVTQQVAPQKNLSEYLRNIALEENPVVAKWLQRDEDKLPFTPMSVVPSRDEENIINALEQIGYKPVSQTKFNVKVPITPQFPGDWNYPRPKTTTSFSSQVGRGVQGGVFEVVPPNAASVDDIRVIKGLTGRTAAKERNIRNLIEEIRASNILPEEVMDSIVKSEIKNLQTSTGKVPVVVMPKLQPLPTKLYDEMVDFPRDIDDFLKKSMFYKHQISKEIKDLLLDLIEIQEKTKLAWRDVHEENVMWDPVKKKIVVVDPGLFMYKSDQL